MRAAFFGTYNRSHSANLIAAAAVRAAGYEIVEFHEPLWERTRDKHASYFSPASLLRLVGLWLRSAWRLARAWRRTGGLPVAVVGFNGQLDILLLKLLSPRYGPRIVFAPLVTVTETLVEDRAVYDSRSIAARLFRFLDRRTCLAADVVVVDTEEHRRYFTGELGVDPSKLLVCYLGADPDAFFADLPAPVRAAGDDTLEVLYFGQYLPLHGLDIITDAVGRLAMRDDLRGRLRFTFIGTGEERARAEAGLRATRADVTFVDWVPYDGLAARIAEADIVLGIFGASRKARMVVPNKVYEAAAVGRAIVTADTPALREVFEDGKELLLCAAEGRALADAIAKLAHDEALRKRLGEAARRRMVDAFSAEALGRAWSVALAGPAAFDRSAPPRVGVAVLCFQDARRTLECLHSVAADGYPNLDVLVVDNASVEEESRALADGLEGKLDAGLLRLERNLGYAGGNNVAMETLFARGCEYVLLLNSDTVVAAGTVAALVRAAKANRGGGPFGPRVADGRPGSKPASLGERYGAAWLWVPRSLLRVRAHRQRPYAVGGVSGCALFVPRLLFERIGGFDETLFAYYEEVDLCLRARESGFSPMIAPEAEVGHEGSRGFAGGMTPLAAFLKARNLSVVGLRRVRGTSRLLFRAGVVALVAASAAGYLVRGRADIARSLFAGLAAASRGEDGPPPASLFAASGYAGSGQGNGSDSASRGDTESRDGAVSSDDACSSRPSSDGSSEDAPVDRRGAA